jgi:hypothetical protein
MRANDRGSASRRELLRAVAVGAVGAAATGVASGAEHDRTYALGWEHVAGGDGDDVATDAIPTPDGGFLAVGATGSYGAGTADAWAVKVDADGTRQWDRRTYAGPDDDRTAAVAAAPGGGYLLTGSTTSFGDGTRAVWVGRTDTEGRLLEDRTLGAGTDNRASAIVTDGSGYAVAYTAGGDGDRTARLARFDREDSLQWDRAFDSDPRETVTDARRTDTGYVVVGTSRASGEDRPTGWVRVTDSGGTTLWTRRIGGDQTDRVHAVATRDGGGYLSVGDSDPFGTRRPWLTAVAADGTVDWTTLLDGVSARGAVSLSEGYLVLRTADDGTAVLDRVDETGASRSTQRVAGTDAVDAAAFGPTERGYLVAGRLTDGADQLWMGELTSGRFEGAAGPPASLDDDPLYEDIDGDGDGDLFDALTYYDERDSDRVESNPRRYDFDGDGDAGDLFDTLALFEKVS